MTTAIAYAASAGHLFQTALSATQARRHSPAGVEVVVVFVDDGSASDELGCFEPVLAGHGIGVETLDPRHLGGQDATFARYHLDRVLPADIDTILYLDGDTQVLGDLEPLLDLRSHPRYGGLAAALDPMVLLHRSSPWQRRRIDRWWASAQIHGVRRERYANSGVLLVARSRLTDVRARISSFAASGKATRFADQDALNAVAGPEIQLISSRWNFPGFMLGTSLEDAVGGPRLVHFMSSPRPWNARLPPWGERFHRPYADLAADHPALAPYWRQFGRITTQRYRAQQKFKSLTERRGLDRPSTARALEVLERSVDL